MLPSFSGQPPLSPLQSTLPPSSPLLSSLQTLPLPIDNSSDPQQEELVNTLVSLGEEIGENETTKRVDPASSTETKELTITTLNIKMPSKLFKGVV